MDYLLIDLQDPVKGLAALLTSRLWQICTSRPEIGPSEEISPRADRRYDPLLERICQICTSFFRSCYEICASASRSASVKNT